MIRRPPRFPLFPSPTLFRSTVRRTPRDDPLRQRRTDARQPRDLDHVRAIEIDALAGEQRAREPLRLTRRLAQRGTRSRVDRKSTRLNSSHGYISYAVFCLKK